jgi:S-phase kinase-associated protein 1
LKDSDLTKLVQEYYSSFILSLDHDAIFHLTLAANYMDIRPLLDLCCAKIASLIKGKSPEEIRNNLNIVNDFSPEEEAKVREENRWADDLCS